MADISLIQIRQQQSINKPEGKRRKCAIRQHAVSARSQHGQDVEITLRLPSRVFLSLRAARATRMIQKNQDSSLSSLKRASYRFEGFEFCNFLQNFPDSHLLELFAPANVTISLLKLPILKSRLTARFRGSKICAPSQIEAR